MQPVLSDAFATRRLRFPPPQIVMVKGIVEAHEGLASFFADPGGEVVLAAPTAREAELHALAVDLAREFDGLLAE